MKELTFKVSGINCEACTKLIKMDLQEIEGVVDAEVSVAGDVHVRSEQPISLDQAKAALAGSEYKVIEE